MEEKKKKKSMMTRERNMGSVSSADKLITLKTILNHREEHFDRLLIGPSHQMMAQGRTPSEDHFAINLRIKSVSAENYPIFCSSSNSRVALSNAGHCIGLGVIYLDC